MDFTPEIEAYTHAQYYNFRCKIQLGHPEHDNVTCGTIHILHSVLVMEGIHDATRVKKRGYTPTTSMGRFTRELYAIVKFSNILVQKERRVLNLEEVPKIIRTKLYSSLK